MICFDCDSQGRDAALRVAANISGLARTTRIVDLAPNRRDGYDFTDALLDGRLVGKSGIGVRTI